MFMKFCKVLAVHVITLLMLCTCAVPDKANAMTINSMAENITANVISNVEALSVKIEESSSEIVRTYEKQKRQAEEEQRAKEEQQAEQEQHAEETTVEENQQAEEAFYWDGEVITPSSGVANGPSGYETYYNLPMGGVVSIMRSLDYDEANYPYWVRDDGCKMLGSYIMVAASLDIRPYGTILPCSRGMAIVCDTGDFAYSNPYQLDIAVSW